MLSSPLASSLFLPTAQLVGGLLATGLALLLVVERRHLHEIGQRALFQRWVTWAVIAPLFALAVLAGPVTTTLLAVAVSWQGLREFAALAALPSPYRRILLGLGLLAAPSALLSLELFHALPPLLLLMATLQPLLLPHVAQGVRHLAFAAFGWGYLAWLPAFLVVVHVAVPGGPGLLLVVAMAVAMSDIGAFTVGKLVGRHQLAPTLSPNKTWEGVAGNLVGALAGVALMAAALRLDLALPAILGIALLVAVGAVWGDLVESALKREFGVKDAGRWLPGFGGLLDRVDSLIVVVPLVYYATRLVSLI